MSIKKILKSIFKLGLIVASFVGIVLLSSYAVIQVVLRGGDVVEVPNVVGDSFITAWEKLEKVELQVMKPSKQYSPVVPQNHIIAQKPSAGSRVKTGRIVRLTISMGREMVAVPDVTGEERRQARLELQASPYRLSVGHESRIRFPARKGVVLGQDPRPGTSIEIGGQVDLLVSDGPRLTRYLVPNVVGRKIDEAVQLLSQLNLEAQQELEVRRRDAPGVVLAQDPPSNEILDEGGSVLLTVSTRSEERRWENLRYLVLAFEVPCGLSRKLVRVEMTDALGTETVLKRLFWPYEVITLPISYKLSSDTKRVTVKVYVDGVLRQEIHADASKQSTLMFAQPWRDMYEISNITIAPFSGLRESR